MTHMRLNDIESQLQEKLKDFDQRIHNMEYDIEHAETKRQADEKKGTDYRMGFDAKIHTLNEHLLEQVRIAYARRRPRHPLWPRRTRQARPKHTTLKPLGPQMDTDQ